MRLSKPVALIILTAFLAALITPASGDGKVSIRRLRQDLAKASRSIGYYRQQVRRLKKQERGATQQLAVAESRLKFAAANLRDIRSQLSNTRSRLSETRAALEMLKKRIKERNDLLATRLVDTYKHGSMSYLGVVLGSTDFWDLINRGYVVRQVLESDMDLIETIKEDKKSVEEHEAILEEEERKRADLEHQQAAATLMAANIRNERQNILSDIEQDRAKYEAMLAELERNSSQIEDMIRRLERTPKGTKRLQQPWRGGFIRPVNGAVTSSFGMRFHPILKQYRMHTGVDLRASTGTPICAAAGGEVIFAGWFGAYGNAVIIDHGGGTTTLYGHQSRIAVRVGANVKQGQVIGYVGSTGWSTGPHLHFEVRKHGKPVNPL